MAHRRISKKVGRQVKREVRFSRVNLQNLVSVDGNEDLTIIMIFTFSFYNLWFMLQLGEPTWVWVLGHGLRF